MSTHEFPCAVCGRPTYCSNDEHALGCGDGGCYGDGPHIEFCSLDCALKLQAELAKRIGIYREIVADVRA